MPRLNFTRVLRSPRFQDTVSVTANAGLIGTGGLDISTPGVPVIVFAIVVPGKSNLRRSSDGERVNAYIDVFTEYRLSAGFKTTDSTHRDADTLLWHGRVYTVMAVEDYTAFGPGFVHAGCDMLPLYPTVP